MQAQQQARAVGGLVDGEHFARTAITRPAQRAIHDAVYGPACFSRVHVCQSGAASAEDEMVEANAVDVLSLDEVEDAVEVGDVVW